MIGIRIILRVKRKGTVMSEAPPDFYIRPLCPENSRVEVNDYFTAGAIEA